MPQLAESLLSLCVFLLNFACFIFTIETLKNAIKNQLKSRYRLIAIFTLIRVFAIKLNIILKLKEQT